MKLKSPIQICSCIGSFNFVRNLGVFMNEMLDIRKNEDFVVNQPLVY